MEHQQSIRNKLLRDIGISLIIYSLPVISIFLYYQSNPEAVKNALGAIPAFIQPLKPYFEQIKTWGLLSLMLFLGILEFAFGLYDRKWNPNERKTDGISLLVILFFTPAIVSVFSLKLLPALLPGLANTFSWIPFWNGLFLIAIADDLTQYWYHRLHHQIPSLWRFHRTHHAAPYMGISMAARQNIIYTVFFSQYYLVGTLVYLGLGLPALFITVFKSIITLAAHSSIPWDKPFYKYKVLHPFAWVLERLISTPATHHAHHADTTDDGVGYYKGNFGNMFFIWDLIFGTGIITRQYPASYGIKSYKSEEWYAQLLWPIIKSKKEGSELSKNGPEVEEESILQVSSEKHSLA